MEIGLGLGLQLVGRVRVNIRRLGLRFWLGLELGLGLWIKARVWG